MIANEGLLMFLVAVVVGVASPLLVMSMQNNECSYLRGWEDCADAHNQFGMTADDEVVLKHMKAALKEYITEQGYRQRGDIKELNAVEDFNEFRQLVWKICIYRKEEQE